MISPEYVRDLNESSSLKRYDDVRHKQSFLRTIVHSAVGGGSPRFFREINLTVSSRISSRDVSRRGFAQGVAWTIPAVTVAAAAPALAASTAPATIQVSTPVVGWTDNSDFSGYIAQGVVITVKDSMGNPVANQSVTLTITNFAGNSNTFYFVSDPTVSSSAARTGTHLSTITLTTDANGQIALDNGAGSGYLRHGSDGTRTGTFFSVTAGGATTTFKLTNSSIAGYTEPGIKPAAG